MAVGSGGGCEQSLHVSTAVVFPDSFPVCFELAGSPIAGLSSQWRRRGRKAGALHVVLEWRAAVFSELPGGGLFPADAGARAALRLCREEPGEQKRNGKLHSVLCPLVQRPRSAAGVPLRAPQKARDESQECWFFHPNISSSPFPQAPDATLQRRGCEQGALGALNRSEAEHSGRCRSVLVGLVWAGPRMGCDTRGLWPTWPLPALVSLRS